MLREETCARNRIRASAILLGISFLLILIVYLPSDFLDNKPMLCLWQRLGFPFCWGCGMTRALWRMLHGEFKEAVQFNWKVLIVAPILAGFYFQLGYQALMGKRLEFRFLQKKFFKFLRFGGK